MRLPRAFRFVGTEVGVKHVGNGVLLLPNDNPWAILEDALEMFEPGFAMEREQPETQTRAEFTT